MKKAIMFIGFLTVFSSNLFASHLMDNWNKCNIKAQKIADSAFMDARDFPDEWRNNLLSHIRSKGNDGGGVETIHLSMLKFKKVYKHIFSYSFDWVEDVHRGLYPHDTVVVYTEIESCKIFRIDISQNKLTPKWLTY